MCKCALCGTELNEYAYGEVVFSLHLKPAELAVMRALSKARGEGVAYGRLIQLAYAGRELKNPQGALYVMVNTINQRIIPLGYWITPEYGSGYKLVKTKRRQQLDANRWTRGDVQYG